MAINKVIDRNNNVLIDLTNDTVSPGKVLIGTKFHGSDGKEYTGTMVPEEVDSLKYIFIDYDGAELYKFTDAEIDALTELPAGPDHTEDNLTFKQWNWTLEELKNIDRTRPDRPIVGAELVTTDGKYYFYLDNYASAAIAVYSGTNYNIDWGDGTVETNLTSSKTHTYAQKGNYEISVEIIKYSTTSGKKYCHINDNKVLQRITEVKLPDGVEVLPSSNWASCSMLKKINIPGTLTTASNVSGSYGIKGIVIPKGVKTFTFGSYILGQISLPEGLQEINFYNPPQCLERIYIPDSITVYPKFEGAQLKYLYLPRKESITSTPASMLYQNLGIHEFTFPDNITSIGTSCFGNNNNIRYVKIPDSVTSIGSSFISSGNYSVTIDLSEQTKVIQLTSSIMSAREGWNILVPQVLLNQYKSASYWSSYANYMVGV